MAYIRKEDRVDFPPYRPVRYGGDRQKLTPEEGRDIITLYLVCGLGYSPIRHILKFATDKLIEDVIRQHRLGRNAVAGELCQLYCPSNGGKLDEQSTKLIMNIASKYNTLDEEYVHNMLTTGTWKDDPVTADHGKCVCGSYLEDYWGFCPTCGRRIRRARGRKLIDEVD